MFGGNNWYYGLRHAIVPAPAPVVPQCPAPIVPQYPVMTGQVGAMAILRGGPLASGISGVVYFKDVPGGTEVCIDIAGLPSYRAAIGNESPIGPHGFHIHEFGNCSVGSSENPFQASGGHWNPTNQPHGNHVGDFPVLFSNNGRARMCFFTNKFKPVNVVGRSVIIHQNPDDYRTQPAGDSGKRLACGVIEGVDAIARYCY